MVDFSASERFWSGKRVFVTGHTGFKGTWLTLWLRLLGAEVKGYALEPPTEPSMFAALGGADLLESVTGNILDRELLERELTNFKPDIVFHLAAQSLVIDSYQNPIETFETNTLGTACVLEACRRSKSLKAIVVVATDKCYENREWMYSYREQDPLGGKDPYSASKAAAELVVASYRESFFKNEGVSLASARAGNVFGGGDWADNRLVPDGVRAFTQGNPLVVRNPQAIRPWQFVLEPLNGYLMLGRACLSGTGFDTAWNFGPDESDVCTVEKLAESMVSAWGESVSWVEVKESPTGGPKEASILLLNSGYAKQRLGWKPLLSMGEAMSLTVRWYKEYCCGVRTASLELTESQINEYPSHN
ncbi:MAG: CDP-glucose 4,6-dehydratase [Candidatus Obscuribacterales bacterium]|nr:CDP-glucose 4,6-dehydratase [Candidatus Obscuribacterales bacterium]